MYLRQSAGQFVLEVKSCNYQDFSSCAQHHSIKQFVAIVVDFLVEETRCLLRVDLVSEPLGDKCVLDE